MRYTLSIVFCLLLVALAACGGQTPPGQVILMVEEVPGRFHGPKVLDNTAISPVIQFAAGVPTVGNEAYSIATKYGAVGTMPMIAREA